jgi:hypothetical protein
MATLSSTIILADTLQAFKKRVPMLGAFSTTFTDQRLRLNSSAIAHVRTLPSLSTYDSSTGYKNGAAEGNTLVTDVPVTIDSHKHVPIKLSHLYNIADQKDVYQNAIGDAAYVLGKGMVDSVLAKVNAANVSYSTTEAAASVDRDTLGTVRKGMNGNGAAPSGRVGIVNSDFFENLDADPRIASRDYYGQQTGGEAYGMLTNVAGFGKIWEYPDFPANTASGSTFTAATTDIITDAAHGFLTGDKVRFSSTTTLPAGLSAATTYFVIRLTADTFKVATTRANAVAGTAVDITDTGTGTHTVTGFENLSAFFFEPRAVALVTGLPDHTFDIAAALGIPTQGRHYVVTDPENGMSLLGIEWQEPGTFDLYLTVAAMWGSAVGAQSGAAGAITDKAGYRVVTA